MNILSKFRTHQRLDDVPIGRVFIFRGDAYRKVRTRPALSGEMVNAIALDARVKPRARYIYPDCTVTRT